MWDLRVLVSGPSAQARSFFLPLKAYGGTVFLVQLCRAVIPRGLPKGPDRTSEQRRQVVEMRASGFIDELEGTGKQTVPYGRKVLRWPQAVRHL